MQKSEIEFWRVGKRKICKRMKKVWICAVKSAMKHVKEADFVGEFDEEMHSDCFNDDCISKKDNAPSICLNYYQDRINNWVLICDEYQYKSSLLTYFEGLLNLAVELLTRILNRTWSGEVTKMKGIETEPNEGNTCLHLETVQLTIVNKAPKLLSETEQKEIASPVYDLISKYVKGLPEHYKQYVNVKIVRNGDYPMSKYLQSDQEVIRPLQYAWRPTPPKISC